MKVRISVGKVTLGWKATIHQLTTSRNGLLPDHNHQLTTGADDPSLELSGHKHWWLAGDHDLEILRITALRLWHYSISFCMLYTIHMETTHNNEWRSHNFSRLLSWQVILSASHTSQQIKVFVCKHLKSSLMMWHESQIRFFETMVNCSYICKNMKWDMHMYGFG